MYFKCRKKYTMVLKSLLLGAVVFMIAGCDSLLPDKFNEQEYTASAIDQRACFWLADTLPRTIQTKILNTLNTPGDTSWASLTDNQIIFANFDYLIDTLQQQNLVQDTLIRIQYPANEKVSYAVLSVEAGETSKDLYLYTSLEYVEGNINEYITVQLVKSDTTLISSSTNMEYETVSCCSDTLLIANQPEIVPIIRSRFLFQLDESSVYLVRFIVSRPEVVGPFKITLL
jgi:hypothetical protein